MSVSKLRLTEKKLPAAIAKAAANSSNVVFVPPLEMKSMGGMMNYHIALKCLQEGVVVVRPHQNEFG